MNPILVYPVVYVLKLEDDCWYIGISTCLNQRLGQHWSGDGSKWTRLHKPVSIAEIVYPASLEIENEVTKRYMEKYGKDLVRGGSWCKV
jgi:predicted GIY-YIG superfamily endonuclease